jgi:hypothetical protein
VEEELGDDVGMYQKTLYNYHKEAFYKAYTPYFNSVANTHLITAEKYFAAAKAAQGTPVNQKVERPIFSR